MKKATLTVEGMSCGNCERHVKEELLTLPGVTEVKVDRAVKQAEVVFSGDMTEDMLSAAVDEAGYTMTGVVWES